MASALMTDEEFESATVRPAMNGSGFPRVSPQEQYSRDQLALRVKQSELPDNPNDPALKQDIFNTQKKLGLPQDATASVQPVQPAQKKSSLMSDREFESLSVTGEYDLNSMLMGQDKKKSISPSANILGTAAAISDLALGVPAFIGGWIANLGAMGAKASGMYGRNPDTREEIWAVGRQASEAFQKGGPLEGWQSSPLGKMAELLGKKDVYEGSLGGQTLEKVGSAIDDAASWLHEKSDGSIPKDAVLTLADSLMMGMGPVGKRLLDKVKGERAAIGQEASGTTVDVQARTGSTEGEFIPAEHSQIDTGRGSSVYRGEAENITEQRALPGPQRLIQGPEDVYQNGTTVVAKEAFQHAKDAGVIDVEAQVSPVQQIIDYAKKNPAGLQNLGLGAAAVGAGGWLYMRPDDAEKIGLTGLAMAGAIKGKGGIWHPEAVTRLATPLAERLRVNPNLDRLSDPEQAISKQQWVHRAITNYLNKYAGTDTDPLKDVPVPMMGEDVRWENLTDQMISGMVAGDALAKESGARVGETVWDVNRYNRDHPETNAITSYLSHVGDYLREFVPAEKLGQYDLVRAVKETAKQDEIQAAKMAKARVNQAGTVDHKVYPDGMKWVEVGKVDVVPEKYSVAPSEHLQAGDKPYWEIRYPKEEPRFADDTGNGNLFQFEVSANRRLKEILAERALKNEGDVMGHCFPPGTLVNSAIPTAIEDLRIGDSVVTHTGAFRKVTDLFKRNYSGHLIKFATRGSSPISCTPEHPILVIRPISTGSPWQDRYVDKRLPETLIPQWIKAFDVQTGDYMLSPGIDCGVPVTSPIQPSENLAWLLGFYAGDGDAGAGAYVGFTLSPKDDVERLQQGLRELGLNGKVTDKEQYIRLRANSREFSSKFKSWFGNTSQEKHIPEFVFNRKWDLMAVLSGLMAADGTYYEGRCRLTSTSHKLIQQAFLIVVSLGFRPSIKLVNRTTGFDNASPIWNLEWQPVEGKWHSNIRWNKFYATPIVEKTLVEYSGPVYNIEVEYDHSYLVNGLATHNCVGGYCEYVHSGESKIYSLRDKKGMSHVTVEVSPGKLPKEVIDYGGNHTPPDNIVQIKGKQNRAPVTQYLPYVQDFVKNGKWGDVEDLANSGLVDLESKYQALPWGKGANRDLAVKLQEKYDHNADIILAAARKDLGRYTTPDEFTAWAEKEVGSNPKEQQGSATTDLLKRLAAVGLGAAAGAYLNQDSPIKGALIGAGLGLIGANIRPKAAVASIRNALNTSPMIKIDDLRKATEIARERANRVMQQVRGRIETQVPSTAGRERVSDFLEGKPGKLFPNEVAAAKDAREWFNLMHKYASDAGVIKTFEQDYVTRIYKQKGADFLEQLLRSGGTGSGSSTRTPFALTRKLTDEQAKTLGLEPVTRDISSIMEVYGDSVIRAVENKKFIETLKVQRGPTEGSRIGPKLVMSSEASNVPSNYVTIDHPQMYGLRVHPDIAPDLKQVFDTNNPNVLIRGMESINTLQKRMAVSTSLFHAKALEDAMLGASNVLKAPVLVAKSIGQAALPRVFGENTMITQLKNGGVGDLVDTAIQGGLKFSYEHGTPSIHELTAGFYEGLSLLQNTLDKYVMPGAGKYSVGYFAKMNHAFDNFMWGRLHTGMKLMIFADKFAQLQMNNPKLTRIQAAEAAASFANTTFGGINWGRLAMDMGSRWGREIIGALTGPSGRRMLRLALFAPDWTYSTTASFVKAFSSLPSDIKSQGLLGPPKGLLSPATLGDLHRQYTVRSAFWYLTIAGAINYYLSGHYLDENKDPTRIDMGDGRTMQWSKHSMEPVHWLTMPTQQGLNKLGLFPKEGLNLLFGTEYLHPRTNRDNSVSMGPKMRINPFGHVAKQFLPIGVNQAIDSGDSGGGMSSVVAGFMGAPIYGKTTDQRDREKDARKAASAEKRRQRKENK